MYCLRSWAYPYRYVMILELYLIPGITDNKNKTETVAFRSREQCFPYEIRILLGLGFDAGGTGRVIAHAPLRLKPTTLPTFD